MADETISHFPVQATSEAYKKKTGDKDTMDFLIKTAADGDLYRKEMVTLYNARFGILDKEDYEYILNPHQVEEDSLKTWPAELRNYDIIGPIVNLFKGEKNDRETEMQVVVCNPDAVNIYKEELIKVIKSNLDKEFVNRLNERGINTGIPSAEVAPYQETESKFKGSYEDYRAIMGQEAYNYLYYNLDLKDKFLQGLDSYLTVGRVYSYKEVYRDDVGQEIVSPFEMFHPIDINCKVVEDLPWVVRKRRCFISQLVDRFREQLTKKDIDWLEEHTGMIFSSVESTLLTSELINKDSSDRYYGTDGQVWLYHVCWKSLKKVGVLRYVDSLGQISEIEVDETYKLDVEAGDIEIEWQWINRVRHGFRIEDEIYLEVGEYPIQREDMNNSSSCKLPYGGYVECDHLGGIVSIVKQGLPYQALYNINKYNFELLLNKNPGLVTLFPLGLIPSTKGWSIDKFFYHGRADGKYFFDDSKSSALNAANAVKTLQSDLSGAAKQIFDICQLIKIEWWDNIGMNRQRYGDVNSSDGKGVNEQAIFRSALISEEIHRKFEKFEEREAQSLIDNSKFAWINGKKGSYINSERRKVFLEIDPVSYLEANYGVFARNGIKEKSRLEAIRSMAVTLGQNELASGEDLISLYEYDNVSQIKEAFKKSAELRRSLEEQKRKEENEAIIKAESIKAEDKAADREIDKYKVDKEFEKAIAVANINSIEVPDSTGDSSTSSDNFISKREEALDMLKRERNTLAANNAKVFLDFLAKERANRSKEKIADKQIEASLHKSKDKS